MLLGVRGAFGQLQYIDTLHPHGLREEARHLHGESTNMNRVRPLFVLEGVEQLFYALSVTHLCDTYHRYNDPFHLSHDLLCFFTFSATLCALSEEAFVEKTKISGICDKFFSLPRKILLPPEETNNCVPLRRQKA